MVTRKRTSENDSTGLEERVVDAVTDEHGGDDTRRGVGVDPDDAIFEQFLTGIRALR